MSLVCSPLSTGILLSRTTLGPFSPLPLLVTTAAPKPPVQLRQLTDQEEMAVTLCLSPLQISAENDFQYLIFLFPLPTATKPKSCRKAASLPAASATPYRVHRTRVIKYLFRPIAIHLFELLSVNYGDSKNTFFSPPWKSLT